MASVPTVPSESKLDHGARSVANVFLGVNMGANDEIVMPTSSKIALAPNRPRFFRGDLLFGTLDGIKPPTGLDANASDFGAIQRQSQVILLWS